MAIVLWLLFGLVFGLTSPIRQGFINDHIPSAQRATVLSLDALFADTGGPSDNRHWAGSLGASRSLWDG